MNSSRTKCSGKFCLPSGFWETFRPWIDSLRSSNYLKKKKRQMIPKLNLMMEVAGNCSHIHTWRQRSACLPPAEQRTLTCSCNWNVDEQLRLYTENDVKTRKICWIRPLSHQLISVFIYIYQLLARHFLSELQSAKYEQTSSRLPRRNMEGQHITGNIWHMKYI